MLTHTLQSWWNDTVLWLYLVYQGDILAFFVLLFMSIGILWIPMYVVWVLVYRAITRAMGKRAMRRLIQAEIEAKLHEEVADCITTVVDGYYTDNKITNNDRKKIWVKYAKTFGLWDLIPKDVLEQHPDPEELKQSIWSRLSEFSRAKFSKRKQVDIDAAMRELLGTSK